jgi:hypothetical protein
VPVPHQITCVDCGGTCHRIPIDEPELGWELGDLVTFRCQDCHDRWDMEVTEDDLAEDDEDD